MRVVSFLYFVFIAFNSFSQFPISPLSCNAPFYHGVASGDPLSDRVIIIWTRVTPLDFNSTVTGTYKVSIDTSFSTVVHSGIFNTNSEKRFYR